MAEIIDLVDLNNNVIGVTDVNTAHSLKQLHRVVGIFLFDLNGDLWLQIRTDSGKYDLSIGGHVKQSEKYDDAAHREMQEEFDVNVPLAHWSTFLPIDTTRGHYWAIYEGQLDSGWIFLPTKEVKKAIKMSMPELLKTLQSSPWLFTRGFINCFAELNRVKSQK